MNKAFKTNQLHKIAKKKQILNEMKWLSGQSCNMNDFHLADELIAEIKSGNIIFS